MTPSIFWAALVLDLILGDPQRFPHPVRGIGWGIDRLERFSRPLAASPRQLKWAGVALTIVVVFATWLITRAVLGLAAELSSVVWWCVAVFIGYTTLALKALYRESWLVVEAVRQNDVGLARTMLSRIVSRDTSRLDREGILRAVIETMSENLSDGVIAPLFYLALGGPALAMAYKAASTIDSMIGYKNERYRDFGWFGARLDDVANYIPARITALSLVAAAAVLRLDYRSAWRVWRRDARKHDSPNAGHPEAAMAGALHVRLGGPSVYFGKIKEKPVLGDGTEPVDVEHAAAAARMLFAATALVALFMTMFL